MTGTRPAPTQLQADRGPLAALTLAVLCLSAVAAERLDAGDVKVDGSFVSTATTGTPPLAVNSPTKGANLNVDMLDGFDAGEFARKLGNTVTVATSNGDFTSIQAAIDSITAAADNPWLVLVGPGEYVEQITMKEWVNLAGAGPLVTTISSTGGSTVDLAATVTIVGNAEIRHLAVRSDAAPSNGDWAQGILADGSGDSFVANVTVEAGGGVLFNQGIHNRGPGRLWVEHSSISAIGQSGAEAIGVTSGCTACPSGSIEAVVQHTTITAADGDFDTAMATHHLGLLTFSTILSGDLSGGVECRFVVDEPAGTVHVGSC